jgi:hypothetical protein
MGRGETVKRIPVIIALFLAVPLIAQTAKLTVPPSVIRECHHYPMTAPQPITKVACEKVGGTWVMPLVVPGPISSDFASVSVGNLVSVGDVTVSKDFKQSVDVDSQTGRVVKLSDEEYARLQKLRQAVADEEKKIALAHGVDFGQVYVPAPCIAYDMGCMAWDKTKEVQSRPTDRWQLRGQWLFINVPRKETK